MVTFTTPYYPAVSDEIHADKRLLLKENLIESIISATFTYSFNRAAIIDDTFNSTKNAVSVFNEHSLKAEEISSTVNFAN